MRGAGVIRAPRTERDGSAIALGLAADRDSLTVEDARFLAEALALLERDPFLPAAAFARALYMSPSHLAHRFRAVAGLTPGAFAVGLRMAEAKRLLVETGLPIARVALEAGYESLGTFTGRFGALVGTTPGRFRARLDAPAPDLTAPRPRTGDAAVAGTISAPPGFLGVAFVGLFPTYLPAGVPVAGTTAAVPGAYRVRRCPPGSYRVLAAAFDGKPSVSGLMLSRAAAVGAGTHAVRVQPRVTATCDLSVRAPAMGDPPVVLALGILGDARTASP